MAALKRQLQDHDWTQDLVDPSPSKNMEEIHNMLTTTIDHCIPYKERTVNHKHIRKEAWLTASIKISVDRNKKLHAKMLKGEYTRNKYTQYNNVLRKTIRCAKLKFYQDMCYEYRSQTKKLWGLINEIGGKNNNKSCLIEYLKINEVREYSAEKISNRFAKYLLGLGNNSHRRFRNQSNLLQII